MTREQFEGLLDSVTATLRSEACKSTFPAARAFEDRVREVVRELLLDPDVYIDFHPHQQAFPDIAVGDFGIEVKFTLGDTWRSVANSVLETNRIEDVKHVYVVYGKMGGQPDVRWGRYEECVVHVRTSHVPRFEVEIGASHSLFDQMGVSYDVFRVLEMHEKMQHIRQYARSRRREGERLWWLEDASGEQHSVPVHARLYTHLDDAEKVKLRAEAYLLCPQIVSSRGSKHKYDDAALYMLTYHGVLPHQTRDLFSAGSVANPNNDDEGGLYIARALKLMERELVSAAMRMDSALFEEYWGVAVEPAERIAEWLRRIDSFATGWKPSEYLFRDKQ